VNPSSLCFAAPFRHPVAMSTPSIGPSAPPIGPMQLPSTWDAVAAGYAENIARYFSAFAKEALRILAPRASDKILDVATGPGTLALRAAAHAAHVTAVDFAPGMIEELRSRLAKDRIANVDAAVMNAESLDLPEGSFDAAFCLFAFMFFQDR